MARLPRLDFSFCLYHIICRGNRGEKIFLDEQDFRKFLKGLKRVNEKHDFRLLVYTLMSNHFHLLLETGYNSLRGIMSSLLVSYVSYFNLKYQLSGHLFQDRYKSLLIQKEKYLWEVVRYIFINPVKAGLVRNPKDYQWGSYSSFVAGQEDDLVSVKYLLNLLGGDRDRYLEFVDEGMDKIKKLEYPHVVRGQIVGDANFVKQVEKGRI